MLGRNPEAACRLLGCSNLADVQSDVDRVGAKNLIRMAVPGPEAIPDVPG